jgi:gamma-D-glutamyl-L-lysine dipeptidyl-peptidase
MAKAIPALLWAALTTYSSAFPHESARTTPSIGYIDVSVATLWTNPSKPRAIDAPALQNPAQIEQWLDSMTTAEYLDLTDSDRTQTQALYGTQVHILNATNDWYEIAIPDQPTPKNTLGYPGWVPAVQIASNEGYGRLEQNRPFAQVDTAATVPLYHDPWLRNPIMNISYGTRLPILNTHGHSLQIALPSGKPAYLSHSSAKIYKSTSEIPYPTGADLIRTGTLFLARPYLWGGTSGFAFDCAGFTGTIYRAHGITIPRDSGPQATYTGHGVSVAREGLEAGDLLFYATNVSDAKTIHHVAMYAGNGEMLEAYGAGVPVRRTEVRFGDEFWGAERFLK